jgi:putative transposase
MIETGEYLWNCMRYVDLNMVRAGVVADPLKWRWCGYDELVGRRRRYRVLDIPKVLELTECNDLAELAANYEAFVEEALAGERLAREARWTESIAVGSERFVHDIAQQTRNRRRATLDLCQDADGAWAVREPACPYGAAAQTS